MKALATSQATWLFLQGTQIKMRIQKKDNGYHIRSLSPFFLSRHAGLIIPREMASRRGKRGTGLTRRRGDDGVE